MAIRKRVISITKRDGDAFLRLECGHSFKIAFFDEILELGPLDVTSRMCDECVPKSPQEHVLRVLESKLQLFDVPLVHSVHILDAVNEALRSEEGRTK